MRLDKFLCQMNMGSRSDVKELIRKKLVSVNGVTVSSPALQIEETKDRIFCKGQELQYRSFVYYMMNKPQGVVSATTDKKGKTVVDLIVPKLPTQDQKRNLIPAGRLDKDTEGLLLLTDDGALIHSLLSPKRHVCKTYEIKIAQPLAPEDIARLEQGVDISETAPPAEKEELRLQLTFPARVWVLDKHTIRLSIREGRFHQVKRMLQAVGNEVTALRRIRFGALELDSKLAPGEFRELTAEETEWLKYAEHLTTGQTAAMKNIRAVICKSANLAWDTDTGTGAACFVADCKKRSILVLDTSCDSVDSLLKAAAEKKLLPEQCIVFANSPAEIAAAKEAGMRVCAITDTLQESSWVLSETERADYYFRDYDEILYM